MATALGLTSLDLLEAIWTVRRGLEELLVGSVIIALSIFLAENKDVLDFKHIYSVICDKLVLGWYIVQVLIQRGPCLKACLPQTDCLPMTLNLWTPSTPSPMNVWASVWASSKPWHIMTFTPTEETSSQDVTCRTFMST